MLFKNTLAQTSTLVTGYLFSLLLAPLLLSRLGLTQFGVWAVTGALATYAGLLDLGVSRAVARFVALYDARGDESGIRETFTLGLLVTAAVTLLSAAVAAAAAPIAVDLLGVLDVDDMRTLLLCSVAILGIQTFRRTMNAVGIGLRRMVPPNVTNNIGNVLNFSFSVGILLISPDLVSYAIANVVADTLGLLIAFGGLRYVWRSRLLAWPSRGRTKEIFSFAMKSQVHWIAFLVNLQTDKILVAIAVDVRAAGAFEIAGRVVGAVKALGVMSVSAMIPTATAEIAKRGRGVIAELYGRYTRRATAVAFPVFISACVAAPALLVAWLGDVPPHSTAIVIVLSLAWFVNVSCEVGMTISTADGRPGAVSGNTALMAAVHLALAGALAPAFGLWGIVTGAAVSIVLASAIFVWRMHRHYRLPAALYLRGAGGPAALALGLAVPPALVYLAVDPASASRLGAAAIAAAVGGAYVLAYWVAATWFDFLPGRLQLPLVRSARAETAAAS